GSGSFHRGHVNFRDSFDEDKPGRALSAREAMAARRR
ncbi:hypothetical protein A2U01_0090813, partial [Trifolium medium]|nr:hypothetical protein [Trifolium medium]